jgi:hypothetical protein
MHKIGFWPSASVALVVTLSAVCVSAQDSSYTTDAAATTVEDHSSTSDTAEVTTTASPDVWANDISDSTLSE